MTTHMIAALVLAASALGSASAIPVLFEQPPTTQAAAADDIRDLVVFVRVGADGEGRPSGSGLVIAERSGRALIATAGHVVVGATEVQVAFRRQPGRWYRAEVSPARVSTVPARDMAILTVANAPSTLTAALKTVLPMRDMELVGQRARVFWSRSPTAWTSTEMSTITEATSEQIRVPAPRMVEGAAGGALVSEHGALLGLVFDDANEIAGATPIHTLFDRLKAWDVATDLTAMAELSAALALGRLRDRGDLNEVSIATAIRENDVSVLADVGAAGRLVNPAMLERALRFRGEDPSTRPAVSEYLELTKKQGVNDYSWLAAQIASGFDPNVRVPHSYYEEESLLVTALRRGNEAAALMLLKNGASPHGYQSLFGTRFEDTMFVTPLVVLDDDRYKNAKPLVEALVAAGMVVPDLSMVTRGPFKSIVGALKRWQDTYTERFGAKLKPTPDIDQAATDPICRAAQARTGVDWCAFTRSVPREVSFERLGVSRLKYLLHIAKDTAYFLALYPPKSADPSEYEYVVVEAPRQGAAWRAYKYNYAGDPLPYCKKDANGTEPWSCWNRYVAGAPQPLR